MNFYRLSYRFDQLTDTFFKDKSVLDIACHDGASSFEISKLGANRVIGIEPRSNLVRKANNSLQNLNYKNVEFVCGDATDYLLMDTLLQNIDTVSCFGVFYHLTDHFKFLKKICTSSCKYLLIETLFGLESPNPTMICAVEPSNADQNGINDGFSHVMVGVPNIVWIQQVLEIFNWQITYFVTDYYGDERMIIGASNNNFVKLENNVILSQDIWKWEIENGSSVGTRKFSIY